MGIKFANSAYATLASGINSSATSITLTTGQGARFPSLAGGDYFFATLIDTSNNLEIVKCTARSTDVLTVVRGQESTTARAFSTGDRIELRITAQGLIDAAPVQSVAGQTGAVVLAASDIASGVFATARLASSGTASSSTFLRGDQSWQTITQVFTAYRVSVTTTQETRAGPQNSTFLNSTSSYVSGLTAITHSCASASNYIILRFSACFRGNATSDSVQMQFFIDGTPPAGGAVGHMNNSTGNAAREMGMTVSGIVYPNDTSSHTYTVGWAACEGGASTQINATEDPNYGTQCILEMIEVSPTGTAGTIYNV